MKEETKKDLAIIAAVIIIAAVLWLFWLKRREQQAPAGASDALPPSVLWGNGGPFAGGGTGNNPAADYVFNKYDVPIPSYHFPAMKQQYMPLFGFVGYSSVGTYG